MEDILNGIENFSNLFSFRYSPIKRASVPPNLPTKPGFPSLIRFEIKMSEFFESMRFFTLVDFIQSTNVYRLANSCLTPNGARNLLTLKRIPKGPSVSLEYQNSESLP